MSTYVRILHALDHSLQRVFHTRCAACGRTRCLSERLSGLDAEYCDDCLLALTAAARHALPDADTTSWD